MVSNMMMLRKLCFSQNADRAALDTPTEARVMPAPTSKSPEEGEFAVDSGASMHLMSKKELCSDELDTVRSSVLIVLSVPKTKTTVVLTANGDVHTHEEAQVFVHDLDFFVTVQLLEGTPGVLIAWKTLRRPRKFL